MIILIITFFILLLISAFFSSSETTLFSLSRVQLLRLKKHKSSYSRKVAQFLRRPHSILISILLGNEFANIAISIVGAAMISRTMKSSVEFESLIAVMVITPIVLVFGEIIPKTIALRFAWQTAPKIIRPLSIFHKYTSPIRKALLWFSNAIIKAAGGKPKISHPIIMEEEYRRLVDQSQQHGILIEEERELIHNVFDFSNKIVKDIMIKREHIFALSINMKSNEFISRIGANNFSRVPIFRNSLDKMIGILHRRDLLAYHRAVQERKDKVIEDYLREPLYISENECLDDLLHEFQAHRIHMALVKKRNKIIGLVTLDDVLEELFGDVGD